ncbi:MAG: sigma-70 family RNA polymerase sigma factor [Lacipirellulaceae bacterium]
MPSADSISSTLLVRLRQQQPDAWERLTTLFGPIVYGWCRRAELNSADAADVTQEVFRSVATGLEKFRRDRPGDSFRGWLTTIARNRIRDHYRRVANRPQVRGGTEFNRRVQDLPDHVLPDGDADASLDGLSTASVESRSVLHRTLQYVQAEFEPNTWQAFLRTTVEQQVPADVAESLGISVNAVYKAKSKVLRRLREELDGLL